MSKSTDQLNRDLAACEQETRRLRQELEVNHQNTKDLLTQESLRQQADNLKSALLEREQDIKDADAARYLLEDELEDAHRKIDTLTFQKMPEQTQPRESAAVAVPQVAEVDDLEQFKDPRIQPSEAPLNMGEDSHLDKLVIGVGVGFLAFLVLLEVLSFVLGKGELFSLIFS